MSTFFPRSAAAAASLLALVACAQDAALDSEYAEADVCFQSTSARFGTGTQIAARDLNIHEFGATIINEPGRRFLIGDRYYPFITLCARDSDQDVTITVSALREDSTDASYEDSAITRRIQAGSCARFPQNEGSYHWRSGDWLFDYSLDHHTEVTFHVDPQDEQPFDLSFWIDEDYRVTDGGFLGSNVGQFVNLGPECLADSDGLECYDIEVADACDSTVGCTSHHTDSGAFTGCRPSCDRMSQNLCSARDDCGWAGNDLGCVLLENVATVETEQPIDD